MRVIAILIAAALGGLSGYGFAVAFPVVVALPLAFVVGCALSFFAVQVTE